MSTNRDDFGIVIRSALLKRGARQKFSLFFLICLSIFIFFLDTSFNKMSSVRSILNDSIYKVSVAMNFPLKSISSISESLQKVIFTFKENERLNQELAELRGKNFNNEYLVNQNDFLRKTIAGEAKEDSINILAKVILDKDSPYLKSIIINRGSNSGIKKGMPVIAKDSLIGRVVEINYLSSRVLLLNDLNSRIPVTLGRESAQAILMGKGNLDPELEYLPEFFEFKDNINIFTSGKDGIFSSGIPIGKTQIHTSNKGKISLSVNLFSNPHQLSFVKVMLSETKMNKF